MRISILILFLLLCAAVGHAQKLAVLVDSVHAIDSKLPMLEVWTVGDTIPNGEYEPCKRITLRQPGNSNTARLIFSALGGEIGIRGGNSATDNIKFKQFKMKIGAVVPTFSGWVPHDRFIAQSEPFDNSLLRNPYFYWLGSKTGSYGVKNQKVEMWINGEYRGIYTFQENKTYDRMGLAKESTTDPNKGFIMVRELGEFVGVTTQRGNIWQFDYPDQGEQTAEQDSFVRKNLDTAEAALFASNWQDPVNGWRKYWDDSTAAGMVICLEVGSAGDSYVRSFYIARTTGSKWFFEPVWDFDFSASGGTTDFLYTGAGASSTPYEGVARMMEDPAFVTKVKTRYTSLRTTSYLRDDSVAAHWNRQRLYLRNGGPIQRTQLKREFLNYTSGGIPILEQFRQTYDQIIDEIITWMYARLAWLDTQWLITP